ncbi:MAG: HAMP domain-containing protein [Magnetococcales bacterium]|nr:HAMP domain-containing protein [Magnetococcales bacterium]
MKPGALFKWQPPMLPQMSQRWWVAFLVLVAAVTLVTGLGVHGEVAGSGGDYSLVFLILLYVNLFLLLALGFLVVANLSRLWLDRRQGRAGSRLRGRMVGLFVILSLMPTTVVAVLSVELLNRGVDSWFSERITHALTHSLELARAYYQESQRTVRHDAEDIARNRSLSSSLALQDAETATAILERERKSRGLDEIVLMRADGTPILTAGVLPPDALPDLTALQEGSTRALMITNETGTRVRAFVRLGSGLYLSTGRWIDRQILGRMEKMESAFVDYNQLRAAHRVLKKSHRITLVLITVLLLLAAIWSGFRIAGEITDPISELVEGTYKVAAGDLSVCLPVSGSDELATLQAAFNAMILRLNENHAELQSTNALLEERRRFMAAILRNISSGVISVNRFDEITLMNPAAGELLGIQLQAAIGHPFSQAIPAPILEPLQGLLEGATDPDRMPGTQGGTGGEGASVLSTQIQIEEEERTLTLLARLTLLEGRPDEGRGFIITFDDLSEVLQAQRTRAWSEVARRIAHEIKNPLTPIQLWAERLRRKLLREPDQERRDLRVLDEGTMAIIRQVDALRVLVNEFSNFARLPRPDMKNDDLNATVREVLLLHDAELRPLHFVADLAADLPPFPYDRGQIRQVLINLLANALAAIRERRERHGSGDEGHLVLSTRLSQNGKWAQVSLADSGIGIPPADRSRVWEPYFTTKKKGTGLGLAIVKKIIEDHGGSLRLRESQWQGVEVTFQLPISGPQPTADLQVPGESP